MMKKSLLIICVLCLIVGAGLAAYGVFVADDLLFTVPGAILGLGGLAGMLFILLGISRWRDTELRALPKADCTELHVLSKGDYTLDLGGGVRLKMMQIKGGTFQMGHMSDDEKPIHTVTLDNFDLGETPVTQAQYKAVMGTNPSHFKGAKKPVECVSWDDAVEFCKKLSQRTGLQFRLPTEAEWEYACRAGSSARFCFGYSYDQLGEYAWFDDNSGGQTHPVGRKRANAWGLYDMHGNVWEWCSDWYGSYTAQERTNPVGANQGSYRVIRGGYWGGLRGICRAASRDRCAPDFRHFSLGFRVACIPSK